ncbi:MAG: hypothetical protein WA996_22220, partial [Candidatus Promineifilaceae bacterium]
TISRLHSHGFMALFLLPQFYSRKFAVSRRWHPPNFLSIPRQYSSLRPAVFGVIARWLLVVRSLFLPLKAIPENYIGDDF